MVLNDRIEIDTSKVPYRVHRDKMPSFLSPNYFQEDRDWSNFCDSLDRRLRPYEEIKARWMVLGVVFTLFSIGIIVGIVLRFVLIDEDSDQALIVLASMFASAFVIFTLYFFLMQACVVRPLQVLGTDLIAYCEEASEKWDTVDFEFQFSNKCSVYWDSDFDAWINVTCTDAVDGN